MANDAIVELEQKIYGLTLELNQLKQQAERVEVPNYTFETNEGTVHLSELFGQHDRLIMIHNMGQGCRYCTLWGDGINTFLPHLEAAASVVMVSKDSPSVQRTFANGRGWRFRTASHGGGDYIREQSAVPGQDNYPGVVGYERDGNAIFRTNASPFGPGDLYCSFWNLLGVIGLDEKQFTPQYAYWQRPQTLDDGGENVLD
ncbi:MAG: DUF899 family protein [Pseudomonadota bacterium]